jgi:hypothetical protein
MNNLCCELNMMISCDSCGVKYCIECHEDVMEKSPVEDGHIQRPSRRHFQLICMATGEIVCDEGQSLVQHATRCIHE